jgi:hypothetical protein
MAGVCASADVSIVARTLSNSGSTLNTNNDTPIVRSDSIMNACRYILCDKQNTNRKKTRERRRRNPFECNNTNATY